MNPRWEDDEVFESGPNEHVPRVRLRRLGAGAVALLLAATIAACGGDDSSSETTGAPGADTTAQSTPTTPTTQTAAANGVADRTAEEILADAAAAAQDASAVRLAGVMGEVRLDLAYVRGDGAAGSVSQGPNTVELIAIGDAVFLRGEEAFWRSIGGAAIGRLLAGKWLRAPAREGDFAELAAITDMSSALGQALRPDTSIRKGEIETVDGVEAIGLTSDDGTLYVATTGDPLPLKIVGRGDRRGGGEMVFAAWNEPVELTAPADAIDVAELQQMSSRRAD